MNKLELLREQLKKHNIAALMIPKVSKFLDEYMPEDEKLLDYLTGFNGSAGICIVTHKNAAIFVDGRYVIAVRNQTDSKLFEYGDYNLDSAIKWLAQNLQPNDTIGIDASLISYDSYQHQKNLFNKNNFELGRGLKT